MNETLKAIVQILHTGTPELKVAAAQVLGELGPKDRVVSKALEDQLRAGDPTLNRFLMQALSRIGGPEAVAALVLCLQEGGRNAELAGHLLGRAEGGIVKPLAAAYEAADSTLRHTLLQILGKHAEPEAITVLRRQMLAADDFLAAEATRLLLERVADLPPARRESLSKALQKDAADKDILPAVLARTLTIVRALDGPACRALLLKHVTPKNEDQVRLAAAQALKGVALTPTQAQTLLEQLEEMPSGSALAREIALALEDHEEWSPKGIATLKQLAASRREEIRLFGLRALRHTATEQTAKLFAPYLHHANPAYREVAGQALGRNVKALPGLLRSLALEKDPSKMQALTVPLRALASKIKPAQLKAMCEKASKLLAAGEALAEPHLELCLAVDKAKTSQQLVDKAVRLRRAHKVGESLAILLHLAKAQALDLEGRYQMALARLLMDHEEGRAGISTHTGDATMGYIASLVRDGFPVFDRLKKENMLAPEDLLRVGRHFNGGIGPERKLGADMLRHVAEKHAKARAGEEARIAIRTEAQI